MSTNVIFCVSLISQSGCKTKNSFCLLQEKPKKIWNFFFRFLFLNFPSNLSMSFPCFAGCKCKSFFQIPQAFPNLFSENFFSSDSSFLPVFRWAPFAVAGAKVEPFSACASFLSAFFWSFPKLFPNSLIADSLQRKVFYPLVGFFCVWLLFLLFCREGTKAQSLLFFSF